MRRPPRALLLSALVCAAAAALGTGAAPAAATLTGFLSAPTDQLAVPGLPASAEVTPEGDVYTGWAEYELRFGRRLSPWDQPTRTLPNPGLPLLSSTLADGPVRYTLTLFAVAVAGEPVAYETVRAVNRSARPCRAQVALAVAYTRGPRVRGVHGRLTGAYRYERPVSGQPPGYYTQPGQAYAPTFVYTTAGRDLDRSGLLLARGPAAASRALRTPRAATPTAPHDARRFGVVLRGHGAVAYTWQIPLQPPPSGAAADRELDGAPLAAARAELARTWAAEEAGAMRISLPETRVAAAYRAALVELLTSRYRTAAGWVQTPNRLQYQAFWLRDAALETQALDLAGLQTQAGANLAFLDTFQQPDGLFISRTGQYDGLGQALWALGRHALLTGDPAYAAAQLGRMQAAVAWLAQATASDPLGLLPAGDPRDDERARGHLTGDDLWAAAGLRVAVADALLAGRPDLAAAWQGVDARFEAALRRALAAALARAGHIPPVLDAPGGQDWGNYDAAYPVEVLPATSPAVRATVAWARAHAVQGLPTYADGRSLHDYLGFPIFQAELRAGDAAGAVAGLYAELAHTTSTDAGWEWDVPPFGSRATAVDLAPHGVFAAGYVALLRDLLVNEAPGGLTLLAGASPAWLAPGEHVAVAAAPTTYGTLSFAERASARGETLRWHGALAPGTTVTWQLPAWARHVHVSGGRLVDGTAVVLPSASGTLAATFTGRRPAHSYALAVAALNRAYRARGLAAPLVPAPTQAPVRPPGALLHPR